MGEQWNALPERMEVAGHGLAVVGGVAALTGLADLAWRMCNGGMDGVDAAAPAGLAVLAGLAAEAAGNKIAMLAVHLQGRRAVLALELWGQTSGSVEVGDGGQSDDHVDCAQGSTCCGDQEDVYLIGRPSARRFSRVGRTVFDAAVAAMAARGGAAVVVKVRDALKPTLTILRRLGGKLHGPTAAAPAVMSIQGRRCIARLFSHGRQVCRNLGVPADFAGPLGSGSAEPARGAALEVRPP